MGLCTFQHTENSSVSCVLNNRHGKDLVKQKDIILLETSKMRPRCLLSYE